MTNRTSYHVLKRPISSFNNIIHSGRTRHSVLLDDIKFLKNLANGPRRCSPRLPYLTVFATIVRSDTFDFFAELVLNFIFKIFEHIQGLWFFMEEIYVAIYNKISMNVKTYCWSFQATIGNGPQIFICMSSKTSKVFLASNLLSVAISPWYS